MTVTTITAHEAQQRVEEYARAVLDTFPAEVAAEEKFRDTYGCDDPTDGGPVGRVIASVEYQLVGLSGQDYDDRFNRLHEWWAAHGFEVLADARPLGRYLWVEHAEDGFRMALQANDRDELYLMCSSPCVWPTGQPDPGE